MRRETVNSPDDRFKVTSTMRDLNSKLKINLEDEKSEKIYWYIKFNLELDKTSVTNSTMQVMDTDGYIMRTYIVYDTYRKLIVVSPIDTYRENKYYILGISKEVRSQSGQTLGREIYIMFMLLNNKISKFEVLKATARLPEPKPRPSNYEFMINPPPNSPSMRNSDPAEPQKPLLPMQNLSVKPGMVLSGVPLLGFGYFTNFTPLFFLGVMVFVLGFFILIRELFKSRAKIYYNLGVYNFNKEKYVKSQPLLEKSYNIDQNNYAMNGLRKVRRFVET